MKKLISLILFIATATVSFAQYPLPETQVHGNLYVNDTVAIGTTTPITTLDIVGSFTAGGDTAFIRNGTCSFEIGGIPVQYQGLMAVKKSNDTLYANIIGDLYADMGGGYVPFQTNLNRTEIWNLTSGVSASAEVTADFNVVLQKGNLDGFFSYVQVNEIVTIDSLKYANVSAGAGKVLTSDANGVAAWSEPKSRILSQGSGNTTTGTTWETLGSYTIAADLLADASSVDVDFAMTTDQQTSDSLLVVFGSDTALFVNGTASGGYVNTTTLFYASSGNTVYSNSAERIIETGTEDNSSSIAVEIKAKSATSGNQTLEYFRITYFE